MSDSEPDLLERLVDEFVERLRRGESPSISIYEAAHPECAERIRDLFPAVQAMEQVALRRKGQCGPGIFPTGMPECLGDYRMIREIGRGGMGVVYEAEQASLSRHVAVKVLPPSALHRPVMLQRFEREAQTAARLHHTNIVPVFGVGEDQGFYYIVMQLIQGVGIDKILTRLSSVCGRDARSSLTRSLPSTIATDDKIDETTAVARVLVRGEFYRRRPSGVSSAGLSAAAVSTPQPVSSDNESAFAPSGSASVPGTQLPLPKPSAKQPWRKPTAPPIVTSPLVLGPKYWRNIAQIGVQAADALQYAHQRRTLHRDIKPANLLVDLQGVVWVSDFGLAKAMEHDDLSQTGDIVGTLRYMAPERFHGQADARSDIYSLGLTLYELLTLRPAYDHSSPSVLMQKINAASPVRPRALNPAIPRDLETIVLKAAAREPEHRYRSAEELADDLQRFLDDRPIRARRSTVIERLWRWSRRNPVVAGLTGLAVALLILVAVVASVGYVRTRIANHQVRDALVREAQERQIADAQRQKAEALSELTLAALDDIFEQFVPNRVAGTSDLALADGEDADIRAPVQPVLSKGAAALLERMLVFYDRLAQQNAADVGIRRKVADANRRIGDIHRRLGHWEQAQAAYLKSIEGYRQLQRDAAGGPAVAKEIARIYNELGNLQWTTGREGEGHSFHIQAMDILKAAPSVEAASPPHRYELARTYYFLGRGSPPEAAPGREPPDGKPPRPNRDRRGLAAGSSRQGARRSPPDRSGHSKEENLREAIQLLERLIDEQPSVADYRHLLACCYREFPVNGAESAGQSAFASADKAIALLRRLVTDFPDVPDYRYDLSKTYARLDFRDQPVGADFYATMEERLRKSLSISEKLIAENPNVPDYTASYVHSLYMLTEVLRHARRPDEAETTLRKALAIQASLAEQFPKANSYIVWKAILQDALAKMVADRGRSQEARALLESAVAALNPLLQSEPQAAYIHGMLGRCYKNLSDVLSQMGEEQQAAEMLRRGREHRPE